MSWRGRHDERIFPGFGLASETLDCAGVLTERNRQKNGVLNRCVPTRSPDLVVKQFAIFDGFVVRGPQTNRWNAGADEKSWRGRHDEPTLFRMASSPSVYVMSQRTLKLSSAKLFHVSLKSHGEDAMTNVFFLVSVWRSRQTIHLDNKLS